MMLLYLYDYFITDFNILYAVTEYNLELVSLASITNYVSVRRTLEMSKHVQIMINLN
jgi:hypothetical protein